MLNLNDRPSNKFFRKKLTRKARKMSNDQLRASLWSVRKQNDCDDDSNIQNKRLLIMEDIYSFELKNRELLEWALKSEP